MNGLRAALATAAVLLLGACSEGGSDSRSRAVEEVERPNSLRDALAGISYQSSVTDDELVSWFENSCDLLRSTVAGETRSDRDLSELPQQAQEVDWMSMEGFAIGYEFQCPDMWEQLEPIWPTGSAIETTTTTS